MASKCDAAAAPAVRACSRTNTRPSSVDTPTVTSLMPNTVSTADDAVSPIAVSPAQQFPAGHDDASRREHEARRAETTRRRHRSAHQARRRTDRRDERARAPPRAAPMPPGWSTARPAMCGWTTNVRCRGRCRIRRVARPTRATSPRKPRRSGRSHRSAGRRRPERRPTARAPAKPPARPAMIASAATSRGRSHRLTIDRRCRGNTATLPQNDGANENLAEQQRRQQQAEAGEVAHVRVVNRDAGLGTPRRKIHRSARRPRLTIVSTAPRTRPR